MCVGCESVREEREERRSELRVQRLLEEDLLKVVQCLHSEQGERGQVHARVLLVQLLPEGDQRAAAVQLPGREEVQRPADPSGNSALLVPVCVRVRAAGREGHSEAQIAGAEGREGERLHGVHTNQLGLGLPQLDAQIRFDSG